jgi:hypothetical protein
MASQINIVFSILTFLTFLTAMHTSPTPIHSDLTEPDFIHTFPEVIPGPGLPSLESMNLTSAQLYHMPPPNFNHCKLS